MDSGALGRQAHVLCIRSCHSVLLSEDCSDRCLGNPSQSPTESPTSQPAKMVWSECGGLGISSFCFLQPLGTITGAGSQTKAQEGTWSHARESLLRGQETGGRCGKNENLGTK